MTLSECRQHRPRPDFTLRALTCRDQALLFDMLYLAIYVPPGEEPPPKDVVHTPALAKYAAGYGQPGDLGFAAEDGQGAILGAAWLRLFPGNDPGYGTVDAQTPELSMAVVAAQRGQGIGSALLARLLSAADERHDAASLSVWPQNRAFRLYQRHGFVVVAAQGEAVTMVRRRPGTAC